MMSVRTQSSSQEATSTSVLGALGVIKDMPCFYVVAEHHDIPGELRLSLGVRVQPAADSNTEGGVKLRMRSARA